MLKILKMASTYFLCIARRAPWYDEPPFGVRVENAVYSYNFVNDFNLLLKDKILAVPLLIGESESEGSPDV